MTSREESISSGEKAPVRVLCSELMESYAGTEAVILNYANMIDPRKVQIDFIARSEHILYPERIPQGSKVVYLPPIGRDPLAYRKRLREIVPEGRYDVLWDNKNRLSNLALLKRSQKVGIPSRVVHSHNSRWDGNFLQKAAHRANARSLERYATELWACSEVAGEGMFGGLPFAVIPNAIDFEKVSFSSQLRASKRAEWGLDGRFAVGVVGRLEPVKNHRFLIALSKELIAARPDIAFVFVGGGSLRDELENACRERDIADRFVFAGPQTDMRAAYSAIDCLAMPSLFEGLPLTAVEAQVNGLPCVFSDAVTADCSISTGTRFVSLDEKGEWVDAIACADRGGVQLIRERAEYFDLAVQARKLEERFCEMAERAF